MEKRFLGISYWFTSVPTAPEIAKNEKIQYSPHVVFKEEGSEIQELFCDLDFQVESANVSINSIFLPEKKSFYIEMQRRARAAQERIISEYICTIILKKAREYPNAELFFLIRDEFQTEKIVGRLGYLGLPMHRLHIMFISYDLSSFMKHYIEYYSVPLKSDLTLLFEARYRGKILGPYPDDGRISMLRTYYCSYPQQTDEDLYPVRINFFGQKFNKSEMNLERQYIKEIFMNSAKTEAYPISGGKGSEKTRLPSLLVDCEEYIRQRGDKN